MVCNVFQFPFASSIPAPSACLVYVPPGQMTVMETLMGWQRRSRNMPNSCVGTGSWREIGKPTAWNHRTPYRDRGMHSLSHSSMGASRKRSKNRRSPFIESKKKIPCEGPFSPMRGLFRHVGSLFSPHRFFLEVRLPPPPLTYPAKVSVDAHA